MAIEKWIAGSGQGLTWGNLFSTEINSLANGNAIISSIAVANGTPLDMFMDISIALGSAVFAGSPFLAFYLYPLNQDGTTYGDGRFGSAVAAAPAGNYYLGTISLVAGTQAQTGMVRGMIMPPGTFKAVVYNAGGVALASGSNTIAYRSYNRSIA